MAPNSIHFLSSLLLIVVAAAALLISPAYSQNCASQTFSQRNTTFTNCNDLPSLRASIHWTYNPSARPRPTLDIAFIATPARPEGWVAWALNPTGTGMVGAQSLIAFRDANGSMVVHTYNISSYGPITQSRIAYDVLTSRAESSDGAMRIFATLGMPGPAGPTVNQVWQVGSAVSNGVPQRHAFAAENLSARNTLQLAGTTGNGNGTATAPTSGGGGGGGGAEAPTRQSGNENGASGKMGLGIYGTFVLIGIWILGL